jgi:hypothetical protein
VIDDVLRRAAAVTWGTPAVESMAPLADDEWQQLLARARIERLEPQLAIAIDQGVIAATTAQAAEARARHAAAMATVLLLDRQMLAVVELLQADGIDVVVLKGTALAHLDYPHPSHRAYGDIDLLVAAPQIEHAEARLVGLGGRRVYTEPRPGFDRRFGKGSSYRMPSGFEVDLHRTLALGPFGIAIEPRVLLAERETFALAGREVVALARSRRFVHACYHAVLGRARARYVPLVDLVLTAPHDAEEMAIVTDLARRWHGEVVVDAAIAAAIERLGWPAPHHMTRALDELRGSPREHRWLDGYRGAGRSSARLTLSAVEALDSWRDRVAYLRAVAWPSGLGAAAATRRLARGSSALTRWRPATTSREARPPTPGG